MKIDKPWGFEYLLGNAGEGWKWSLKIIHVNKGHRTSLQYHVSKDEYWFFKDGRVKHIKPGKKHRLSAKRSKEDLEILEVYKGEDEEVVRLEDDYGRES